MKKEVFANKVGNMVRVLGRERLPNGVSCLTVPCNDYDAVKSLPPCLEFEKEYYGYTGWNSDCHVAYYRTDAAKALAKKV